MFSTLFRRRAVSAAILFLCSAAAAAPTEQEEREARKRATERYLQFTKAARDQVLTPASCPFSPASIVMIVGTEPDALAAHVKRLGYEPYTGAVRGAEGTLASRAGGDWDRALLLRALLAEAGYKSTLKVAARTPDEAAAVVAAFLKRPAVVAPWFAGMNAKAPETMEASGPGKLSQQFQLPADNRKLYAQRERSRLHGLVGEALDAGAHETPRLLAALEPLGKPGQTIEAWHKTLLAGAGERVEVEVDLPDGKKILSTGPDAAPLDAERLATAVSHDEAPADRVARFDVRLAFTVSEKDQPPGEPVVLLEQSAALGSLFRSPLRLEIVPSDEAAAAKPVVRWTKDDWHKFVSGFQQFQAILRTGDEWTGSKVFDLTGQVMNVAADGRVDNASQIGGAVGKGMGGLGFGGDDAAKPEAPTSRIDAILLTLQLTLPGQAPRVQQRMIYGRAIEGATPVFTADMAVAAAPVSPHATSWLLLDAVTRNAPLMSRLLTDDAPKRFEQTEDAKRLPMMLYDWHTLRLMAAQRILARNEGLTLLGGPCVVLHNVRVATGQADKTVVTRHAIDVAFDDTLLLPRSSDSAAAAAQANATLGIASTVLESALMRKIDPALGARGAYSAFEDARVGGQTPLAVPAAGDTTAAAPPALVAWSLGRNEPGRTLVFPHKKSPRAWWSVDLGTGTTIGRGDGGEGQSAMEYLQITKKNVENLKCMVGMSNQVLGGSSQKDIGQQFFLCMTGTDNPGSGHGIPGGVEGGLDSDLKVIEKLDIGIGPIADALGGAKDLYDLANGDDPILYTGR
ncbi:MAG TPA: hypothetical protein VF624_10205 [Tepidisphaeraceae bacterium]